MKYITIILFLLFGLLSVGLAQQGSWQQVSPLPQGNPLDDISAVDANTIFACGADGTFMNSTNGGDTWFVDDELEGLTDEFFTLDFVNSQVGWLGGQSGDLLHTTDGGRSWVIQNDPSYNNIYSLSFVSTTTGWACGDYGTILFTSDGGNTWTIQTSNTTSTLFSMNFVNSSTGWACGENGTIMKTTNGGVQWNSQASGTSGLLYGGSFSDVNNGWVTDNNGNIFHTSNGGNVWWFQSDTAGLTLSSIYFQSSTRGWAAGAYGTIVATSNGGQTWVPQLADTYKDFFGITFANVNTGWAVGDYGTIFKTTDGGNTWVNKSGTMKEDVTQTYFSSSNTGYVVGLEGSVIQTTNGGYTWSDVSEDSTDYDLYGLMFLSDVIGYAVGDNGYIFKTVTGGNAWNLQQSTVQDPLNCIFFTDAQHGWVGGSFGDLLKTSNGGATWIPETTNVSSDIMKVKFYNTNIGWAVTDDGSIIKSTDGGVTWNLQESTVEGTTLYSLSIIDQNTVYVSGDYGTIVYTANGGTTWVQIPASDVVESLYDVATYGDQYIWFSGDGGLIYGSSNGGVSYTRMSSNTLNTLYNIQVIPGTTGAVVIASGDGNTVVKSILSPLPVRTWTGLHDSLWTNASNWQPSGVPGIFDSVYIPATANRVVLRQSAQQVNVGSLTIANGGKMFIGAGISTFVASAGITMTGGTLAMETNSETDLISGGGFDNSGGTFTQNISSLILNGGGNLRGTFNTINLTDQSNVTSSGNIFILQSLSVVPTLTLRSTDTLNIVTTDTLAIQGGGLIEGGTIKRAIAPGSTSVYPFESPATTVQFLPGGTIPSQVLLTSYPNTLAPDMPDTIFVKRYYVGKTIGGSNCLANVYLRFDPSETDLYPEDLAFFIDSSGTFVNLGSFDYEDDNFTAVGLDSISTFTKWYLGDATYYPKSQFEFNASMIVTDNGLTGDSLQFGALKGATPGIDYELGESILNPIPSHGTFDARWIVSGDTASLFDYLPYTEVNNSQNVYTCKFQPGPSGYPIHLTWSFYSQQDGPIFLIDSATQGTKFNINMKTQSTLTISDTTVKSFQVVQTAPFNIGVNFGWNMVSVPVTPTTNSLRSYLFSTATSSAFGFHNGYVSTDTLKNGKGYWLKFPRTGDIGLEGSARLLDTFKVDSAWNMIGTISVNMRAAKITSVPTGIVINPFYGFAGGYSSADTLIPGKGYWIKVNKSGKLILNSSALEKEGNDYKTQDLKALNAIVISDRAKNKQTLYYGDESSLQVPVSWFEMPPLSPVGVFDARFTTNRMFAPVTNGKEASYSISLQSAQYPVILKGSGSATNPGGYVIVFDAARGTRLGSFSSDGKSSVKITNPSITNLKVRIVSGVAIPKQYALEQNYPNPFNPATTIQFNLPDPAVVTLQVFNVLGQQVATLLDHTMYDPGIQFATWDAGNYSSGVYFYRLIATRQDNGTVAFQQVKKLMLIK